MAQRSRLAFTELPGHTQNQGLASPAREKAYPPSVHSTHVSFAPPKLLGTEISFHFLKIQLFQELLMIHNCWNLFENMEAILMVSGSF